LHPANKNNTKQQLIKYLNIIVALNDKVKK
jgi:hypothetical protein